MKPIARIAAAFVAFLIAAQPADAAPIGLSAPLSGPTASTPFVEVSVEMDLNGAAENLVGLELYVAFAGLSPVPGSYALGAVFQPFLADLIELNGVCASLFCSFPDGDPFSPTTYLASVNVFAPARPAGPGGLFTMRFATDPSSATWSLNLLGDAAFALLSDPCDPADAGCVMDPVVIPFAVVPGGTAVPSGTAILSVTANAAVAPVPEPASLAMMATGMALLARRTRRAGRGL